MQIKVVIHKEKQGYYDKEAYFSDVDFVRDGIMLGQLVCIQEEVDILVTMLREGATRYQDGEVVLLVEDLRTTVPAYLEGG